MAVAAGAGFVGFVHYPKSPRHVSIDRAAALKKLLLPTVKSVVVLVNPSDELLAEISANLQPDYIQLHGDESVERVMEIRKLCPQIGIIKAISVKNSDDINHADKFCDIADYILFDAKPTNENMMHGGNGIAFDWNILAGANLPQKWFLSGGLNAGNVREAVRITGAKMLDVSSGVERSAGVKDMELIRKFIKNAKYND